MPEVAQWRQNLRYDGLWWRKFAHLGCVYGPEWWKRYTPPVIAATIFMLAKRERRGASVNLQRILGNVARVHAERAALRMFVEFAHCFTEAMEHYGPRPHPLRIDVPENDALAATLTSGQGAVVLTGHFGNWDVAAKELRAYGRPINLVMAREVNAPTSAYVRQAREAAGVQVIYSDSSVFSSLNMVRALRRNEVVAIQLDRPMDADGMRLVPFFGAPAAFPSGPFVLARVAGVPLIPVFVPRLGRRHYAVRVGNRFDIAREARDARSLARVMGEVAAAFEAVVREFPTQWFQFLPFWKDVEPGQTVMSGAEAPRERLRASR